MIVDNTIYWLLLTFQCFSYDGNSSFPILRKKKRLKKVSISFSQAVTMNFIMMMITTTFSELKLSEFTIRIVMKNWLTWWWRRWEITITIIIVNRLQGEKVLINGENLEMMNFDCWGWIGYKVSPPCWGYCREVDSISHRQAFPTVEISMILIWNLISLWQKFPQSTWLELNNFLNIFRVNFLIVWIDCHLNLYIFNINQPFDQLSHNFKIICASKNCNN